MYDVIIIGCGIVGASAAFELSKFKLSVAILEKENDVACGTTKANSAIVHAGFDPAPETKMARLNVLGSQMMEQLCDKLSVEYKRTGSLVLAFNERDMESIESLYKRGLMNGVEGLAVLGREQVLAMEANINPDIKGALYAPTAAIVNPWRLCIAMAQTAVQNGAELHLNSEVTKIVPMGDYYRIETSSGFYDTKYIVNAAGVYSDRISEMVAKPFFKIIPIKGEYYLLDKSQGNVVKTVVFQPPDENGKGVLIAPTVHGNLIVGPTSEAIDDPDDTAVSRKGLENVVQKSLHSSKKVDFRESIRNFAGVRAASKIDDFIIEKLAPRFINAAAIKSPGLTAAPAIGLEIAELLRQEGLKPDEKEEFRVFKGNALFKNMPPEEKTKALSRDRSYGRVICRCETITEGDILAALNSPIPPVSLDGVKRRCGAGMGRCQGGFCSPRVHEIISRETGISMERVCKDGAESFILTGRTKDGKHGEK